MDLERRAQLRPPHDEPVPSATRSATPSHRHGSTRDGLLRTRHATRRPAARAIVEGVRPLGIEVRVGVHTGECETIDSKVGGIAVNIGARVGAAAAPSEVLVSQTVKDLVVGSGAEFEERGEHELKGVPGRWRLYRVVGD